MSRWESAVDAAEWYGLPLVAVALAVLVLRAVVG